MKICVYAICKNEENHVKRWYQSMTEADEIYVLDTGSTDNTKKELEKLGVHVISKTRADYFSAPVNKSILPSL